MGNRNNNRINCRLIYSEFYFRTEFSYSFRNSGIFDFIKYAVSTKPIIVSKDIPSSNIINFLISSSIGFLSAIIGIGGGSFSVPTLTMFPKNS